MTRPILSRNMTVSTHSLVAGIQAYIKVHTGLEKGGATGKIKQTNAARHIAMRAPPANSPN